MGDSPEVIISRSERLRIPKVLDSGRIAKLRTFRTRITDWTEPSAEVFEEPVIVAVKEKRERVVEGRKLEWYDEIVKDHLHDDVARFQDLIEHKRAAGYVVSVRDAVLAYMLVFKSGTKSMITGFLRAFPDWKEVDVSTVGEALSKLKAEGLIS